MKNNADRRRAERHLREMMHKLTALVLLLLMAVVTATSQPGLHYCFCAKELVVGSVECASTSPVVTQCSSSCDCSDEPAEGITLTAQDECSLSIQVHLDDFTGPIFLEFASEQTSLPTPASYQDILVEHAHALRASVGQIRGSPPPLEALSPVPIRVRYSVFRV